MPACTACEKARVRCVGYDPITKREIPRSYVYHLETRLSYFESLLVAHNIPFKPAEAYDADSKVEDAAVQSPEDVKSSASDTAIKVETDLPPLNALLITGARQRRLRLTPYHTSEPWRTISSQPLATSAHATVTPTT